MKYEPADLHKLSSRAFEDLVAQVWFHMGYDTELTNESADGGVDAFATRGRQRVAIQAKRWAQDRPVRVGSIREYSSLAQHPDITRVVIVTSSRFTPSAEREADLLGVEIVDPKELIELISFFGIDIGMPIYRIPRRRRWRLISSLFVAVSSVVLIYIGAVSSSAPFILGGLAFAAVLILSFLPAFLRLKRKRDVERRDRAECPYQDESALPLFPEEDLPASGAAREQSRLGYHDLETSEDLLNHYGKPDIVDDSRTHDRGGEIWRYRIPAMVFHIDVDGRIVSRYP